MCAGSNLKDVIKLTPTPPGNNFLNESELLEPEQSYPLDIYFCEDCFHLQLGHVVDPKILYQNDYTYVSATSTKFVEHLKQYAADMVKRFDLKPGDLVTDIGSNDGTCLKFFQNAGMNVIGIDPATEIAKRATESGIETIGDFFTNELALKLREKYGPAKFITSHNACAHIENLDSVIQGVQNWLADDGLFVLEVGYLLDIYQNTWFDTMYHEHLDFHSVAPFKILFERFNMEMFAVQRISPQGGSIRVFAQKATGPFGKDGTVEKLIELERESGLHETVSFIKMGHHINEVGADLRAIVKKIKESGKTIAGYGAATKATTLLSHFRIGNNELDFIADDNPLKQGLYSPLSHIPVVSANEIYIRNPDYLLILAWNFAEPIMELHKKYAEQGGKFIIPMPIPKIV
jgi:hypothetical protein